MPEYTVLSRRLLTGTISDLQPSARIAWITILFEAEKLRGKVKLPVRDLAKMASITTPEAAEALRIFQAPDRYSSSKQYEGRRLLPVEGEEDWYIVATWEQHAEERARFFNQLRQQRHRARNAKSRTVTESNGSSRDVTKEPEPEPEPEKEETPRESKDSSASPPTPPATEPRRERKPRPSPGAARDAVEAFTLGDDHRIWAAQNTPSVPPDVELEAWKDRLRANEYRTNQGPVRDPAASWRTAMRNAEKWGSYASKREGNGRANTNGERKDRPRALSVFDLTD